MIFQNLEKWGSDDAVLKIWCYVFTLERLEIKNNIKSKSITPKYPIDTKTKARVIKYYNGW